MRWFTKSTPSAPAPAASPVAAFWSWWSAGAKERVAAAIDSGTWGDLAQEVSTRVRAIHPDLQWELAAGDRARHTLCVTSAGVPELRPLAQRWRRAAPAEDPTWQYEPARRRDTSVAQGRLELDGHTVELGETTIESLFDDDRLRFDVTVHHPQFAAMEETQRMQFTFLVLDWALGEDDVERWVGGVESAVDPDPDARALAEFVAGVDAAAARPVQETWMLLQGRGADGQPVVASARRPLRWIDDPLRDQHHTVTLTFDATPNGLPTAEALTELRRQEEDLAHAAGPGAVLLAHESHSGVRLLHMYSDSEDQPVSARIDRWAAAEAGASVHTKPDPAWRAVRHLT